MGKYGFKTLGKRLILVYSVKSYIIQTRLNQEAEENEGCTLGQFYAEVDEFSWACQYIGEPLRIAVGTIFEKVDYKLAWRDIVIARRNGFHLVQVLNPAPTEIGPTS